MTFPLPTIHPNGSGRKALDTEWRGIWHACRALDGLLAAATPHDRDYYVEGPDVGHRARLAHSERRVAVAKILADAERILGHVVTP